MLHLVAKTVSATNIYASRNGTIVRRDIQHRLLQNISESAANRDDLLQEIKGTHIFISTLSSINGRQELFNLKNFDVAIIDEASQILEPQLIGVLSKVDKFILIRRSQSTCHHCLKSI